MIVYDNVITNTDHEVIEPLESIKIYEHIGEDGKKYTLTLNLVGTTPAHVKGWELVKKRDLIMVGISMGNGYFSRNRLEIILTGMASYFSQLVVFVPDIPTIHTYRAVGYDERTTKEKIRKHRKDIRSCCKRIFKQIFEKYGKETMRIMMWDKVLAQGNHYQVAYQCAIDTYTHHSEFRTAIQHHTERYILSRLEHQGIQQFNEIDTDAIEKAAYYLIEEMAFHEIFHQILGKESLSSYYKELEVVPNYISGNYGNVPNKSAGWTIYHIYEET